jgi:FkbM family methyltransferase
MERMCADQDSQIKLKEILAWRDQVLRTNSFARDDRHMTLNLSNYHITFRADSAFSAIEVYYEIFKENAHFQANGFFDKKAQVVLDIGANQGFYTLKIKETCRDCQVIAVEPNPAEYALLCVNLQRNMINNVHLENVAVAPVAGSLQMEIIPEIGAIGGQNVKIPQRRWIKDEFIKKLTVPALSLDDIISKYQIQRVDILKIDIEGLEFEVLGACTKLNKVDRIVVEYHSTKAKAQLIALLRQRKFNCVHHSPSPSNTYSGDLYFERLTDC